MNQTQTSVNHRQIGYRIKEVREQNHLSQAQLAEITDLSVSYICRIQFQQLIDILQRRLGRPDRCIYIFQGFVKTSGISSDLDRDSFNPACHLHTPPPSWQKKSTDHN